MQNPFSLEVIGSQTKEFQSAEGKKRNPEEKGASDCGIQKAWVLEHFGISKCKGGGGGWG